MQTHKTCMTYFLIALITNILLLDNIRMKVLLILRLLIYPHTFWWYEEEKYSPCFSLLNSNKYKICSNKMHNNCWEKFLNMLRGLYTRVFYMHTHTNTMTQGVSGIFLFPLCTKTATRCIIQPNYNLNCITMHDSTT